MLKNITIGQYYPSQSPLHRMDPRGKILLTIGYVVLLFSAGNLVSLLVAAVFGMVCFKIAHIPLRTMFRSLKPILPIIIFTSLLNMFFLQGEVIAQFWIFTITREGILFAVKMAIRIAALIAGTSLLTYTTTPIRLTDGIERLLSPFAKIGFPAHELAMMMTIALRFIPTLLDETDKIMSAQKARGADMESGGIMKRVKAMVPILIPLFVSAFRRADELALAMECRCYHGGKGRTRMKQLKYGLVDLWGLLVLAVLAAAIILCNIWVPVLLP